MLIRLLILSFSCANFLSLYGEIIAPTVEYKSSSIRLIWSVPEHDGVVSFVVERSEEKGYFTPIQELSALFYNTPTEQFVVEDENLQPGREYRYRLRYRYPDGRNRYSKTVVTYFDRPQFELRALYAAELNPELLGIDVAIFEACELKFSVFSPHGAELFSEKFYLDYGEHSLELGFPDLPEGYYYLRMESDRMIQMKAMLIQQDQW